MDVTFQTYSDSSLWLSPETLHLYDIPKIVLVIPNIQNGFIIDYRHFKENGFHSIKNY